jgi:DNA-binding LacI/PurR family transcriptional regulator
MTIRDVARLANVSLSTASAVINGKTTVREELR